MLITWHYIDSETYWSSLAKVQDTHMYLLSDTNELYRGRESYSKSVELCEEFPTIGAVNRLYINRKTFEGKIFIRNDEGTSWIQVIKPISNTVENNDSLVTGSAVITYVSESIKATETSFEWDSENHTLGITKGETTQNIVFDGLGVNLALSNGELQLLDASGNAIGDKVNLGVDKFVTSGEYNAETESIILYFNAEKTDKIEFPVAALIDTYDVEGDKTLSLSIDSTNNIIKGSVNISTADGNVLVANEDGLFVAATDISGKMDKVDGAVEDNIAVFGADGQVVDSGKSFDDLVPNNTVYTGATYDEAIAKVTSPVKGDVIIVSAPIGSTGKTQKTVYQYDGSAWVAFDSDYDASKILLPEDWLTTTKIGNIQTLTNGQATIATAGTDMFTALQKITVTEDTTPDVTQPAVSLSNVDEFKAYEVGTTVPIALSASLSAGSYQYGRLDKDDATGATYDSTKSAGISAKAWTIKDSKGVTKNTNSVTFDDVLVEDTTNYTVTATASYDASEYKPSTNLKKPCSVAGVAAGSKSKTTAAITGYRNAFFGVLTDKDDLTTDAGKANLINKIRNNENKYAITKSNAAVAKGTYKEISVTAGTMRVIVAYPADATNLSTITQLSAVKDKNASDAEINSSFTLIELDIPGVDNYTAKKYKVYYKDFANAVTTANTYKVTL